MNLSHAEEEVSILVLVDVALQLLNMAILLKAIKSFNPCFSGCCSATVMMIVASVYRLVSILVLVDVALQRSSMLRSSWILGMFQSLF